MIWTVTNPTEQVSYSIFNQLRLPNVTRGGIQYLFSEKRMGNAANITSEIRILEVDRNETDATCLGLITDKSGNDTVVACVVGKS